MPGYPIHFMDRAKVRVRHGSKKGYFVARRRAWFMFDPVAYATLVEVPKGDGLSGAQIEAKGYCDFAYFRKRVPRLVPPPPATLPSRPSGVRALRTAG